MKTSLLIAVLTCSALPAFAGSGSFAWTRPTAAPSTPASTATCANSFVVPVTTLAPAWQNGRGPLAEKQIGTKRVCSQCPVTGVVTTAWANGRGPTAARTTSVSGTHDCSSGCSARRT